MVTQRFVKLFNDIILQETFQNKGRPTRREFYSDSDFLLASVIFRTNDKRILSLRYYCKILFAILL